MNNAAIRVLMIDDDEDDFQLTREMLADLPGNKVDLEWARDIDAGRAAIARGEHDAYLVDYRLGKGTGLDLLREAVSGKSKGPVIFVTGQGDRELALRALEEGAADYLVKGKFDAGDLERSIRYALQQKRHADELESKVQQRTAELKRAEQVLQEADRRKDEFLATLAHELRGPLAPLRNMLEILKRADGDGAVTASACATLDRQLSHMTRLVDDLLDVSRITQGKMDLKRRRTELASVLYQAIEACRTIAEEARHDVSVDLPSTPIYLDADPVRLAQVFSNLLNNSCKYTPPGGMIQLTAERDGAAVEVTIKDTGVGIPPEKLNAIFELFTQVDQSLERSQGGLGIGLTIVRRLIEMHGGTVAARSAGSGRGSEFVVRLPIRVETQEREQAPPPAAREGAATRRRILVVDDNRDSATSLAMLLQMTGNDARTAHDGEDAVRQADEYRPELILLDIGLPKMNGYDACHAIRKQPWGKEIAIVALTGWGQDDDLRKSQAAGFNAHLVKPVDFEALSTLIADLGAA
jgi:signal transduction histidine kinase